MKALFTNPSRQTDLATWEGGDKRIGEIEEENEKSLTGVWYRGHARVEWQLTTTLERRVL